MRTFLVLAGLALAGQAAAQSCPLSWEEAVTMARLRNPGSTVLYDDAERLAEETIAWVNAIPPASDLQGPRVVVLDAGTGILVIIGSECARQELTLPKALFPRRPGLPI